MAVYIWRDVYHIDFGQADAVVLALCLDDARKLLRATNILKEDSR